MHERQLRLGDTLDDYCPRERRLTAHAIVAMVGPEVKQVRCTACDAEHEYKQGKVPRQRKKPESPAALYAQVAAGAPKRVAHDLTGDPDAPAPEPEAPELPVAAQPQAADENEDAGEPASERADEDSKEDGPVHRPLIRASLPRPEGQPPSRPNPEFTIHQPGTRPGRFRPRFPRGGGQQFFGNRSNGNNMGGGQSRGGGQRQGGGRPPQGNDASRPGRRHGRRRPK